MKDNLIKRYIYAVIRHLPYKNRADVEKELDGLIAEMLDESCGEGSPTEADIEAVLRRLGTPEELAAKYSGDEGKFLISGIYYISYKRTLKTVMPIVIAVIMFGSIIAAIKDFGAVLPDKFISFALSVFGELIGAIIAGAWQSFAMITVLFAVMERFKISVNSYDEGFSSALPELPKKSEKIGAVESVIGIIIAVAIAVLLLEIPHVMGGMFNGVWVTLFNTAALRELWVPIITWAILGVVYEIFAFVEGRYTKRLAAISVITNALIIVCAAVVFLNNTILNPDFIENMNAILNHNTEGLTPLLLDANIAVFIFVCVIAIVESLSVFIKAWKHN